MYDSSLFHSLLAINEKDLPSYFPYPLDYNIPQLIQKTGNVLWTY